MNDQQHAAPEGDFDYDQFLRHSGTASGGGYLKNWKEDGFTEVWLIPNVPPRPRWMHRFWQVYQGRPKNAERDSDKVDLIGSLQWNCLEREQILKKQKFRVQDVDELGRVNGPREYPPIDCPHCMLQEWVRTEIREHRLQTHDLLWALQTPTDDLKVLAGSWTGIHSSKPEHLPQSVKTAMRAAGVQQDEVFMEVGTAQLEYLCRVVEAADPEAGVLKARVAPALGALIQKAIYDTMKQTQRSQHPFNPREHFLLLRWEYNKAKPFGDRYDLVTMPFDLPSERVVEAARQVPSLGDDIAPGDPEVLMNAMKAAAKIDIPWDELFGPAIERFQRAEPWGEAREAARSQAQVPSQTPVRQPSPPPQAGHQPALPSRSAPPARQEETIRQPSPPPQAGPLPTDASGDTCDVCGYALGRDDVECQGCGSRYDPFSFKLIYDAAQDPNSDYAKALAARANPSPAATGTSAAGTSAPPKAAAPSPSSTAAAPAMPPARQPARRARA